MADKIIYHFVGLWGGAGIRRYRSTVKKMAILFSRIDQQELCYKNHAFGHPLQNHPNARRTTIF